MYLKRMLDFAAKDKSRPVLQGVHVTDKGYAEAADGFGLVRMPFGSEEDYVLDGVALRAIKPGAKDRVTVNLDGNEATVQNGGGAYSIPILDLTYPDTDAIWKQAQRDEPLATITLDAKQLKGLVDLAGSVSESRLITLKVRCPHDAREFETGEARGLIIPIFIRGET